MNPVAGCLMEQLGWIARWLILLPVVLILSTPFVLVIALGRPRTYWRRVGELYGGVLDFWRHWGRELVP